MFLTIGRTFKEGLKGFVRNNWLSLATVGVLAMSLYVVSILYVVTYTANNILKNIENRVNISVYFKQDFPENDILAAKDELQKFSLEIKSIDYVSKEQALENFKRDNADEPVIIQSLEEIGDNPLLPSLVIKANQQDQYEQISKALSESAYMENISRINYGKNKEVIDRLNSIILTIRRTGIALGIIFAAIAILITFNTIRMTIYTQRKEIEVKRLVGASNFFIRLPFIFEGILYGTIASIVSMAVLFVTLRFVTPYVSSVIPTENLVNFYIGRFFIIFGIQFGAGILLGIVSSWIAMRKYLKI